MITLKISEEELNHLLHGLYLLEDQSWFIGKEVTNKLIEKLNSVSTDFNSKKEVVCDI